LAAASIASELAAAPETLIHNPRLGTRLTQFAPNDVRRIIVGDYEIRYEISDGTVYILRIWHTREDR